MNVDNNNLRPATAYTILQLDDKVVRRYQKFDYFINLLRAVFKPDNSQESAEWNKEIIQLKSEEQLRECIVLNILLRSKKMEIVTSDENKSRKDPKPPKERYINMARRDLKTDKQDEDKIYQQALYLKQNDAARYERKAKKISIFFLKKDFTNDKTTIEQWFSSEKYPFKQESKYAALVNRLVSKNPEERDQDLYQKFIKSFSDSQYERLQFVMAKDDINYTFKQVVYRFFIGAWWKDYEQKRSTPPSPEIPPKISKSHSHETKTKTKNFLFKLFSEVKSENPEFQKTAKKILKKLSDIEDKSQSERMFINFLRKNWGYGEIGMDRKTLEEEREHLKEMMENYLEAIKDEKPGTLSQSLDNNNIGAIREQFREIDTLLDKPRSDSIHTYDFSTLFYSKVEKKVLINIINDMTEACIQFLLKINSFEDLRTDTASEDNPVFLLDLLVNRFVLFFAVLIVTAKDKNAMCAVMNNLAVLAKLSREHKNFLLSHAAMVAFNQVAVSRIKPLLKLDSSITDKIEKLEVLFDERHNFKNYQDELEKCADKTYIPLLFLWRKWSIARKEAMQSPEPLTQEQKKIMDYQDHLKDVGLAFGKLQSKFSHRNAFYSTNFISYLFTLRIFDIQNPDICKEFVKETNTLHSLSRQESLQLSKEIESTYGDASLLLDPKKKTLQKENSHDSTGSTHSFDSTETVAESFEDQYIPTTKEWASLVDDHLQKLSDLRYDALKRAS